MKNHWTKEPVPLATDEDYYVALAIEDAHHAVRGGLPRQFIPINWVEYLLLLESRLDHFLGEVDE